MPVDKLNLIMRVHYMKGYLDRNRSRRYHKKLPTINKLEDFPEFGIHRHIHRLAVFLKHWKQGAVTKEVAVDLIYEKSQQQLLRRPVLIKEIEDSVFKAFGTTTRGKVQSRNQFSSIRNLTSKGSFWSCHLPRLRSEVQDQVKINRVVEEFPYSVADLWECSPLRPEGMSCEHILSCLFEPDELIAAGNLAKSEVMSLKKWMHVGFDHCDLFCPNPMRGYSGINFNKKPSARCRDNTGRRKYVVLEIDGLRLDNQASVIDFLTRVEGTTLRMVVYSGRKSLHATFDAFPNEEDNRRFISNLVTYGGDSRMYFPEQQSRLPAVARRNIRGQVERTSSGDICQRCIFLNPKY